MKTLFVSCIVMLTVMASPVQAAEQCEDTVHVKVNGLVCDFCARALEKVFGRRDDVAGVAVDLNQGDVIVQMQPGESIDNDTLTSLITDSGYDVTSITKGC